MSRTYRRKNALYEFHQGLDYGLNYGYISDLYEENINASRLDKNSKEYKKALKRYLSDKSKYRSSVPSWFVNMFCERTLRRKTKHAIYQYYKNENTEVILPKYVHNAGWYYY